MVETQLNIFDTAVIGILLLSSLIAFFRGFVKEVLSLGAWIGAGLLTLYYFPDVAAWLEPRIKGSPLALNLLATLGTYITALVGFSIFNSLIIRYVKSGADVGVFDNMLGLIFGALRGAFIVSLGFMLMTFVLNEDNYPEWIAKAKTREYVEEGAKLLAKVAPHYLSEFSALNEKNKEEDGKKPDVILGGNDKEKGYTQGALEQLQRIMQMKDGPQGDTAEPVRGNEAARAKEPAPAEGNLGFEDRWNMEAPEDNLRNNEIQ